MLKRKLAFNIFAIIFLLIFLSSLSNAQQGEEAQKLTLDNGLTVILKESHSSPVVAFNMWVNVGSVYEKDDEAGIAHVFEHMLFKGTKKRGVGGIAKAIDEAGGYINAYTSMDMTVYHLTIASRYFDTGLDIISDAIQNSTFDPKELKKEELVILEELKMGEDEPSSRAYKELLATAYEKHPYGRPVIGYEKTVRSLTREHILNFYKQWYVPNNMVLVVVGDFKKEEVFKKINNSFADFKSSPLPERKIPVEPEQMNIRTKVSYDDIKEANLNFAFHIPALNNEDVPALDILSVILGQGESSRLYKRIKSDLNLVNSISSYSMTPKYPGLFLVGAALEKEKIKEAVVPILKEVYLLKKEEVNPEELDKAKLILESDFIYDRETVQGEAGKLGYFETIAGGLDFEKKYIAAIKNVTAADIKKVAEKYFNNSNLTASVLAPQTGENNITPQEIISLAMDAEKELRQASIEKTAEKSVDKIIKKILPNGITLLVKEDHEMPIVAIDAVFLGGVRFEPENKNGISNFVAEMLTKGTMTRSAADIAREVESIAGGLDGFSGKDSFGIKAKLLSRFLNEGIDLISDVILNPSFDESEYEKKKEDILLAIKNQDDELTHLVSKLFNQILYQKHPYSRDVLGTKESISSIKREDLSEFYKKFAVPENLVFAIVGDVKTEDISLKMETVFKSFKKGTFSVPEIPEALPPETNKSSTIYREKKQAHILFGFLGVDNHNPDRYALEVLSNILSGQGGRLFMELRDKQSLAYSVTSVDQSRMDKGFLAVYIGTSPEKIDNAIEGIKNELMKLTQEKVGDEELERTKKSMIGNFEIGLQRREAVASEIAFNERYGLGFDAYKKYAGNISAVTSDDILRVAKKYINFDHYVLAIVKPKN